MDRRPPASRRRPLAERMRRTLRRRLWDPLDAHLLGAIRRHRNRQRDFTPVFVTGAMGSGTTLVTLLLGQCNDVACVVTESARQVARDSVLHVAGIDTFASVESYRAALESGLGWSPERVRWDLLSLYRRHAGGSSRFALDKGPNTGLVRAQLLARAFPGAHFVVVFRDPVANVEGFRRKWPTFGRDPLGASIAFYRSIYEAFFAALPALGGSVTWVEYEALLEDDRGLLDRVARRIGLAPALRRRRLPRRGNHPGQGIRNVARSRIGLVKDANEYSHRNLSMPEIERIRAELAPLHERLRHLAGGLAAAAPLRRETRPAAAPDGARVRAAS